MIQMLYWIASAFPSLAMTRGEGRKTWACSAPGAFPSLTMTIKGRGKKRAVRRGKGRREKKSCGRCGNLREGEKKEQRQGQAFKGGGKRSVAGGRREEKKGGDRRGSG